MVMSPVVTQVDIRLDESNSNEVIMGLKNLKLGHFNSFGVSSISHCQDNCSNVTFTRRSNLK